MKHLALGIIAVATLACGGKKDEGAAGGGGGGGGGKKIDVAAVNALVPADLKDKLVFEERTIVEERGRSSTKYTVAAPKGWTQDMKSFASLKPDKDMGFMTKFDVGTNCDGACEPKDWAKVVEKVYSSYLGGKVIKDVKGANSRALIAESGGMTIVLNASWTDGAKEYSACTATLEKEVAAAAPAFEKACEVVNVSE